MFISNPNVIAKVAALLEITPEAAERFLSVGSEIALNPDGTFDENRLATPTTSGLMPALQKAFISPIGGGADDWPALNALTATCKDITLLPGTYQAKSVGAFANGTTIRASAGVTVVQTLPTTNGTAAISGIPPVQIEDQVLSANAAIGANTITVATLTNPTKIIAGTFVVLVNANNECSGELFMVLSRSGSGPYTITLDHAIKRARSATTTTAYFESSVPQNINFFADGATITGTGDRFVEFVSAWDCHVTGLNMTDASGIVTTVGMSFDIPSAHCSASKCTFVLSTAAAVIGFMLESAVDCQYTNCLVSNTANTEPFSLRDCYECDLSACKAARAAYGIYYRTGQAGTSDPTGCVRCTDTNSVISNATLAGVVFTDYADNCGSIGARTTNCVIGVELAQCTNCYANEATAINGSVGMQIDSTSSGGVLRRPVAIGSTSIGISPYASCRITDPTIIDPWVYGINVQTSGVVADVTNPLIYNTAASTLSAFGMISASNGRIRIGGGKIIATGADATYLNSHDPVVALNCTSPGVIEHNNLIISGYNGYGGSSGNGGTGFQGNGAFRQKGTLTSDAHFNTATVYNSGTLSLTSATSNTYSYPDINAGDLVTVTRQSAGGTPAAMTWAITNGTGVVVTHVASDTSVLTVSIGAQGSRSGQISATS